MKDKGMDRIIKNSPKITKKMLDEANKYFRGYLFFEPIEKKDGRKFYCTCCNKEFTLSYIQRATDYHEINALTSNHNESGLCPHCKSEVIFKNIGKSRTCTNLKECINFVFVIPKGYDKVYIMCYSMCKDYKFNKTPEIRCYADSMYYITQDEGVQFLKDYYSGRLYVQDKIKEPFTHNGLYRGHETYKVIGLDKLQDTILKYSGLNQYSKSSICKYLALYPTHKPFEMMVKLGLTGFVDAVVYSNQENKRLIDWQATKAQDVFKMSKQEFNELRRLKYTPYMLKVHKAFNKIEKLTITESKEIMEKIHIRNSEELIELSKKYKVKPKKLMNYLNKVYEKSLLEMCHSQYHPGEREIYTTWRDYINAAIELKYDLTQEIVIFPKDLTKAHDTATGILNRQRKEERLRRQAEYDAKRKKEYAQARQSEKKLYKKRVKQYAYENEQFAIVVPKSMDEIIQEGQLMKHCVGGYAVRHAKGQTTILFLRDKSDIDKPLYTIEMWDKELHQVQGFKNQTPLTPEAQAFFDEWLEYVKSGQTKQNKKATAKAVA